MAAPSTIPNGLPSGDHGRKPSVTITAAGASGFAPNGGPVAPAAQRAGINFGQFNTASGNASPSVGNSPLPAQASLSAQQGNPRITAPAKSPSPIPQPAASGGRPPSGFQSQNGPPHFGSMGGPENGTNPSIAPPQGPDMNPQSAHLRRQSSQQSDVSVQNAPFTPGGGPRNAYMRNNSSRNQSFAGQGGYPQQPGPFSPSANYRQIPAQQRPGPGYAPQFQGQQNMGVPGNSAYPPRSPGYQGSQPGTPSMVHQQPYGNFSNMPPQSYPQYSQHQQNFGQQPEFNQQYGYYMPNQNGVYPSHPAYLGQGAPSSPGPYRQAPPSAQQQFRQGQFQTSQPMSRSPSHASGDRPVSSLGAPPQSQTPVNSIRSHTPSQSISSRSATAPAFTIPKRGGKGIVIKDANGNVVNFEKPAAAAASLKSPTPAPTPPPVTSSTPAPSHSRADSKSALTADEIKASFAASVRSAADTKPIQEESAIKSDDKDTTSADADSKAAKDKETADAAAAEQSKLAEESKAAQTAKDKEAADKLAADQAKLDADKASAEKESAEKESAEKAASEKAASEKAAAEKASSEKAAAEKASVEAEAAKSKAAESDENTAKASSDAPAGEDEAARKLREEEEEFERQIAEMEAAEKEEEERQAAYEVKKKAAAEAKAAAEKISGDAELKRQEREAEALEEKREKERSEPKGEDAAMFASLSKPALGPGADGAESPSEDSAPPPAAASKAKPTPLKLDVNKPVEPPQPTPFMKSLSSARMLVITETIKYPEGIQSPNPALIKGGKRGGRVYDPIFLMQFAEVFTEKPSVDWDDRLKKTIGDPSDPGGSAGPKSARTPAGGRAPSGRGNVQSYSQGPMGAFTGQGPARAPVGRGSTSESRFAASTNPIGSMARPGGGFNLGAMSMPAGGRGHAGGMAHAGQAGSMGRGAMSSSQSGPGRQGSKRPYNGKESEKANKSMPLTANGQVKELELSKNGWKPPSVAGTQMTPDAAGHMPPDMVQRKVKAALNKMTPERFDKITGQILEISAQSREEADGRTLRQVIQLTFEKACDEAHWAAMYAKFCFSMLQTISDDIKDENILSKDGKPISGGGLFRKYLLNRCQEEFEHGWEANLPEKKEGENEEMVMLSDEYYTAMAAKRKGLGLVQFIGELYKLRMLSIKIMHQCFLRLLDFTGMPEESTIESIVKLMRAVGGAVESERGSGNVDGQSLMNEYFARIDTLVNMEGLPSRMHFMLLDIIDLRRNGWRSKDDAKGPKTIQEIHEEASAKAAADALRQQQSRSQGRVPSGRGGGGYGQMPPPDYQRNTVDTSELRKLGARQSASRNASSTAQRTLGPTSMFSRSGSGRQGLGPGMSNFGKSGDSRSASKKDESGPPPASANAFSALAGLQNESEVKSPVSSPPLSKAQPVAAEKSDDA